MAPPDAITAEKLSKLIGTPRCPVILDVRREALRGSEPRLLPGAWPLNEADLCSGALGRLAGVLAGQAVVVVCAEGHGRSQGTAAWLRHLGLSAEYLEGGQAAWTAAGLPAAGAVPSRAGPRAEHRE